LKSEWQAADKLVRGGHQAAYEKEAKYLYGLLREAWERALEEVLLGGIVERFRPSVQTQHISTIADITAEDCRTVDAAMTKCSRWLPGHDHAAAARAALPESAELKATSMHWRTGSWRSAIVVAEDGCSNARGRCRVARTFRQRRVTAARTPDGRAITMVSKRSVEDDLIEQSYEVSIGNFELAAIHLRDARNLLYGIQSLRENRALSKATILMAAAALESNLTYLAHIALKFAEARPGKFRRAQVNFLRGVDEAIDDNGRMVETRSRQVLLERMQIVPSLMGRAIDRTYELSLRSAAAKKLERTIARRDAIVHPRFDRYISAVGWWEAAEAVDAVELYLQSVDQCLHPYLMDIRHSCGRSGANQGRCGCRLPNFRQTRAQKTN